MKLFESIGIAFKALSANKLRSILTMLGIIIGVGAVIALMSVGRGAQSRITSTFEQLGTNVLNIVPRSPEVSGMAGVSPMFSTPSLTLDDAQALENIGLYYFLSLRPAIYAAGKGTVFFRNFTYRRLS